jgi:hypothetical protein
LESVFLFEAELRETNPKGLAIASRTNSHKAVGLIPLFSSLFKNLFFHRLKIDIQVSKSKHWLVLFYNSTAESSVSAF